jgi:1,4-dihydroxy-2-naphthoate polyprenyltransferase
VSPVAVVPFVLLALAAAAGVNLLREPDDRAHGRTSWAVRVGALAARKQTLLLGALGILAAPLVLPAEVSRDQLAMVELPALAVLAFNATTWRSADARLPGARAFVLRNAVAAAIAIASWAALWLLATPSS